jgi:hypothetical protein
MRYASLLLAVLALAGCESGLTSPQTSTTMTTASTTAGYMSPEQSSKLIVLPGDTTTLTQLRYLSASR